MSESDSVPKSGFYIVNHVDRPCEEHLAEKRSDGKFYYVHPSLRGHRIFWGMTPELPVHVEDFGILVDVKAGVLVGILDESIDTARYPDGLKRKWQGKRMFSFEYKSE